jgi:hypothetical protein
MPFIAFGPVIECVNKQTSSPFLSASDAFAVLTNNNNNNNNNKGHKE